MRMLVLIRCTCILYEEDFLKRMIQQAGQGMTRLLGFVTKEDYLAAEDEIAYILRMKGEILSRQGNPSQALQWYETSLQYLVCTSEKKKFSISVGILRRFSAPVRWLLPGSLTPDLIAFFYLLGSRLNSNPIA